MFKICRSPNPGPSAQYVPNTSQQIRHVDRGMIRVADYGCHLSVVVVMPVRHCLTLWVTPKTTVTPDNR